VRQGCTKTPRRLRCLAFPITPHVGRGISQKVLVRIIVVEYDVSTMAKTKHVNIEKLVALLNEIVEDKEGDAENWHMKADGVLCDALGPEVSEAFYKIERWYA